jgi:membrane dipeptidase
LENEIVEGGPNPLSARRIFHHGVIATGDRIVISDRPIPQLIHFLSTLERSDDASLNGSHADRKPRQNARTSQLPSRPVSARGVCRRAPWRHKRESMDNVAAKARLLALALTLASALAGFRTSSLAAQSPDSVALSVLRTTPLIDGHNDLPWAIREDRVARGDVALYDLRARTRSQTDVERLRRGMVGGQVWSVYVPCDTPGDAAASLQREQIALARALIARYPEVFGLALDADDVQRIFRDGRIASLLGMEGGHALGGSLDTLRAFFDAGVRTLGLTHRCTNDLADAATDRSRHGGLSRLGVEVVREMNRLGMLVDLAHASPATMRDALDASEAPVVWSHAGARGVVDHPRNVPDDVLARLPANGGVVMITFVPEFIGHAGTATLADVADHIDHARRVTGVDHVGLGGDFEGSPRAVAGLEDVSTYPALLAELSRRGWSREELAKLAGGNFLRVLRQAQEVSIRLLREQPVRAKATDTVNARRRDG